jgi:hypothetical protein
VKIKDFQLKRALERQAKPLTAASLAAIARLDWTEYEQEASRSWKPIGDLSGLEACTGLKYLGLIGNHTGDLTPLAGLAALEEAWIQRCGVEDLRPLSAKPHLAKLSLSGNRISSLAGLEGLTALTELSLDENKIESVEPLERLVCLSKLRLDRNQIAEIGSLGGLTAIEELWLSENPLADIAPLRAMTALTTLHLAGTKVSDPPPLSALPKLKELSLRGTPARGAPHNAGLLDALMERGVCIDGEQRMGASASWKVEKVVLKAFARLPGRRCCRSPTPGCVPLARGRLRPLVGMARWSARRRAIISDGMLDRRAEAQLTPPRPSRPSRGGPSRPCSRAWRRTSASPW